MEQALYQRGTMRRQQLGPEPMFRITDVFSRWATRPGARAALGTALLSGSILITATSSAGTGADSPARYGIAVAGGEGALGQRHDSWRVSGQQYWRRPLAQGRFGTLRGYWDLGLTLWDASDLPQGPEDDGARRLYALGLGPVLRWELPALAGRRLQPFLELGVGLSILSDNRLRSGKVRELPLGSHWQFEDRGVIGVRIGQAGRFEIAYQRMHHSNLNLASRNHGVDSHLLLLGYRW